MPGDADSPLAVMNTLLGVSWEPGDGPSTTIASWLNFIAARYPEMKAYCNSANHLEYFQWCGLTVGYCVAKSQLQPVFGDVDVERFLWAKAWMDWGEVATNPKPGDVVILDFGGGHQHVTLFKSDAGGGYWDCTGGNQSHQVKTSRFPRSSVIGIRRPAADAAPDEAGSPTADDPSVPNKYPELPVVAYRKTTMSAGAIAAALAAMGADINVKRAAYALICNEAASGKAGINNNYGGLQADGGRWAHMYDSLITATCVLRDNSGARRRFLCFDSASDCFGMIASLIQRRGLYIGGHTHFITNMDVNTPIDWAVAYYKEWVIGDADADIPTSQLNGLQSLYQSAVDALP